MAVFAPTVTSTTSTSCTAGTMMVVALGLCTTMAPCSPHRSTTMGAPAGPPASSSLQVHVTNGMLNFLLLNELTVLAFFCWKDGGQAATELNQFNICVLEDALASCDTGCVCFKEGGWCPSLPPSLPPSCTYLKSHKAPLSFAH